MTLGILASGNLGFKVLEQLITSWEINFVMTDKKSEGIISLCKDNNVALFEGNPRKGACANFISDKSIDVLISVNYLFIIEKELIELPKTLAFNIHGSLLPKYRGRTPHVWAIINNERETGITAHLIDEGCDTGAILEQQVIEINKNETGATLLGKYENSYLPIIENVLTKVESNSLRYLYQDESKATYFGKRTPEDGQINWNWQKERIRNWVRAQAAPYPGAFSIYKDQKIIIDEISYTDYGFSCEEPNGKVLSINPILVKTPNGVVEIKKVRNRNTNLKLNSIL
ncbi:methionyl-tRNA formyltransferase [Marivirga salinae]|uniref:Methionyl-tRNA formyltransferase n=1 Tax=Marivirga salinarum TaxID=3059078 RepID=A0AA51NC91_9BACT|nr:methionyl-tRNA formyltransferase [Marivirga sp. BDSF4-3]WMN12473.1 methionyl-tRNA formyltransferase [Marivirga sp. BDSF4-3]